MALIAIDMDGTLVNGKNSIPQENIESIRAAQKEGIHVVISTGRMYESAKETLDEAGLSCPIVCLNGSQIYDKEANVLHNDSMSNDVFAKALAICEAENKTFIISTSEGSFTKCRDTLYEEFFTDKQTGKPQKVTATLRKVRNYTSIEDFNNMDVYKILFLSKNEEVINRVRLNLMQEESLLVTSSHSNNVEINAANVSKGAALLKLAPILGVDLKESMAIGDSFNDVSMFNRVGFSVAMGNAKEELQRQCAFVTKTNDEAGVAHAIYHFLDQKQKMKQN